MTQSPPPPLPDEARALLAAYRDDEDMPAEARRRVWRAISAEPVDAAAPPRLQQARARWGWAVGGLFAAAAAVLLVAHLSGWEPGASTRDAIDSGHAAPDQAVIDDAGGDAALGGAPRRASPSDRAPSSSSSSSAEVLEIDAEPASPESAPADPTPSPTVADPSPSVGPRASSHGSRTPSEPAALEAPTSDLAAERILIAGAWRALSSGAPGRALELARSHADRFPRGMLAPEREAVRAVAACRKAGAPRPELATEFARAHPGSPLIARIREVCGGGKGAGEPGVEKTSVAP